ncbi:unnamed protein product [Soboliphyme baturini]|uniref:Reverse transcriptase n=1 Tax=Soboliphyme baturini TaxID=241478 RepID=A0A183ICH1_9BILA|nr:unnamed protein product [Soboliphyme baturini]
MMSASSEEEVVLKYAKLTEHAIAPTKHKGSSVMFELYSAYDYVIGPLSTFQPMKYTELTEELERNFLRLLPATQTDERAVRLNGCVEIVVVL